MKKLLLLLAITTFALTGCKKDDPTDSIEGSRWERYESGVTTTIHFMSDEDCKFIFEDSDEKLTALYTYSYNHPDVIFTPVSSENAVLRGKIVKNKIEVINTSNDTVVGTFTKK